MSAGSLRRILIEKRGLLKFVEQVVGVVFIAVRKWGVNLPGRLHKCTSDRVVSRVSFWRVQVGWFRCNEKILTG